MKRSRGTPAVLPPAALWDYPQSLVAALEILDMFDGGEHATLGVSEVAETLGMGPSTAHRYLTTAVALGFLERAPLRRYRLGARSADVGLSILAVTAAHRDTEQAVVALRDRTGYTASIAVLTAGEILYVRRAHGRRRGQFRLDDGHRVGSRAPACRTAAGRVLLAGLSRDELVEHFARAPRGGGASPTPSLERELAKIRDQRLSIVMDVPGVCSIAAPIPTTDGSTPAAVDVTLPAGALHGGAADELAVAVTEAAGEIAEVLDP